jgi:hypothetical protein
MIIPDDTGVYVVTPSRNARIAHPEGLSQGRLYCGLESHWEGHMSHFLTTTNSRSCYLLIERVGSRPKNASPNQVPRPEMRRPHEHVTPCSSVVAKT